MELECIIATGNYLFLAPNSNSNGTVLKLEYSPYSYQFTSHSRNGHEAATNMQCWNSEQISDFVRKLGFLDTEKAGGDKIKHFLHVSEVCV